MQLELEYVKDRSSYMDYLLLADESIEIIGQYINEGEMYRITFNEQTAGACLFTFHPGNVVEIKNIALAEEFRGMGIGQSIIKEAFSLYKSNGFQRMIVGTANSSIANIKFYQKAGFRMGEIIRDFFLKYPEPIYENGIRALDMIVFYKDLSS